MKRVFNPNCIATKRTIFLLNLLLLAGNLFSQNDSSPMKEISKNGLELNGNNIIQTATGNFGLGTTAPKAKLDVNGDAFINGNIKTNGKISFGGDKVISFTPASDANPATFSFGGPAEFRLPASCSFPYLHSPVINQFSGIIQSYGLAGTFSNIMTMGFDGANGIIDIAGNNVDGMSPRLLINYYCGKDVYICTGSRGGKIVMATASNNAVAIGDEYIPNGYKLSVKGKIIAEELNVKLRGNWPDYVFEPDYKLRSIADLEKYVNENKHLPEIPDAEKMEKDGINTSEIITQLVKQQEQLTLYIIEQNKRIEELEKKISN
jgi:hypothetical protein